MKLISKITLVMISIMLLIMGTVYFIFKTFVIPDQINSIKIRARSLALVLEKSLLESTDKDFQRTFQIFREEEKYLAYVVLTDTAGRAVFHSDPERINMIFADSANRAGWKSDTILERIYVRDKDIPSSPHYREKVYDVFVPLLKKTTKYTSLGVGISLKFLDELEYKYIKLTLYILVVILIVIIISFIIIYRSFIRPIKELSQEAKNMRSGTHIIKVKRKRKDEIGDLFQEFSSTSEIISKYLSTLKSSEVELKNYIDRLPNINVRLSLDGSVTLANSVALRCVDFTIDEIKKYKFWELFGNDDQLRKRIKAHFDYAINNSRSEFFEKLDLASCKFKIINFSINLVKDDESAAYLVVDGIDVTEKVLIDNELKEKSRQIKAIFDNVPGYLFFKDNQGRYITCNQKFAELVNKNSEEIVAKTDFDLFPHEKAVEYQKQDKLMIETGKSFSIDEEDIFENGITIKIMKRKVPLKDIDGNIVGVIGLAFDITTLKNIEKALKDSEARFKSLVENIPYGVVETDYEGNIVFINEAITRLSGFSSDEILVKKNWELANKKEDQLYLNERLKEIKDKAVQPKTLFFSSITKSGKIIELQVDSNIRRDNSGVLLGVVSVVTDITEKKRIQNELIKSEEKYRNIFEKSSLGIYRTTADGKLIDINLAFAHMFGYESTEEMKNSVKYVPDLYVNALERKNLIEKLRNNNKMMKFEIHFRKKDGSVMIGNLNIRALPDEDNNNRILEGFIEDITERFLYEKKIKEQLVFLQTLIDTIPNPILYRNKQSLFEGCNIAYEKLVGKSKDAIIGKTVYDVYDKELADQYMEKDRELFSTLQPQTYEILFNFPDKTVHDFVTQRAVYYHMDGSVAGMISVLFDVTDRKINERELKQKADLLDIAPVSFFVIDTNSNLMYWNKGSELLYGVSSSEITGKDLVELMTKGILSMQEYSYLLNIIETVLEKEYWEGDFRQTNSDGKEIIIESKAKLAKNLKGEAEYILIVNLDVTERKKLENQLLLSQRLESLGTLASGIAHDLNNMLSPIVLGLDIIKNKLRDDESIEWIKTLQDTAKRGSDLVRQILSFARGLSDKFTYVQPRYVISEFIKIMKGTFPKSIQISKAVPNDLWAIMGDSTQINQLLMNLCVNARDAMPEGGNLKISAENIIIDENLVKTNVEAKLGPYILMCVSDTGSGIDPKIISKIFDPFFTTKEIGKGTGLGLSTVFNIVKNHKGFINIYSELGKGTSFKIYLPAVKSEEEEIEVTMQSIPYGKQETVLVVDDETAVREIIRATLEAYGYEVLSASNGAEAVAIFAKNLLNIKAAIVDMIMPVMDGTSTIQALKTINPEIKIIASSGFDDAKDKPIIEIVDGFLAKPFTAEAILKLLSEILNS